MKNCFTQLIYDSQRSVKYFIFSVQYFQLSSLICILQVRNISETGKNMK